jgi:ethanolaminephosphotransferase
MLYYCSGFAVFLYVNLDCMDGKQARRTQSSSPLGQLFDHGCDALALGLLLTSVRIAMRVPPGWEAVGVELSVRGVGLEEGWEGVEGGGQ